MKHCRIRQALAIGAALLLEQGLAFGVGATTSTTSTVETTTRSSTDGKVPDDLTALSLDDLLNVQVQVTSVSRTAERARRAAAALFVITQEDIRRSGATSIPEALRLAPGVSVARIDSNKWAISIRGANSRFYNKLLVLMDGRTLYDPLHAGVYWDVQDTILEDVDRIEIVRGPGTALWGANAVTGLINIITKKSSQTQGTMVGLLAGEEEVQQEFIRHGGRSGKDGHYRVWAKSLERDDFVQASGASANDGWTAERAGLRCDWDRDGRDHLTFASDVYGGKAEQITSLTQLGNPAPLTDSSGIPFSGGNARVRWQRDVAPGSDWAFQAYYDRTERTDGGFQELRDTYDLDYQRHLAYDGGQDLVFGFGHRVTSDVLSESLFFSFDPQSYEYRTTATFFQYRFPIRKDRLTLTLGSRFEYNDYTHFEYHPTARFLWTPSEEATGWFAVSRGVRTPSRFEHDLEDVVATPAAVFRFTDDSLVDSEKVLSYEAGYRVQATEKLAVDVSAFYEKFQQLPRTETGTPFLERFPRPAKFVVPSRFIYELEGTGRGYELFFDYAVSDDWKLALGFSHIALRLDTGGEGSTPENQGQLRSYLDLTEDLELNTVVYGVEQLPGPGVPGYYRVDAQLAWHITSDTDLSFTGQNLFEEAHPEFGALGAGRGQPLVQRAYYGKLLTRF